MENVSFTYNDKSLLDFNCMLCNFDSTSNIEVLETPSITFNTIQNNHNDTFKSSYTSYENSLESGIISICKIDCHENEKYFTQEEVRNIYKWLDTRKYKKFIIDNDELFEGVYFIGGFTSIQPVKNNLKVIGFQLKFISELPYGLSDDIYYSKNITTSDNKLLIVNDSDDVKPVHPYKLKITLAENGDLTIKNNIDHNDISIKNCKKNETITVDCVNRIIETNNVTHKIYDDFNYNYFRLIKTDDTDENIFTINLPCKIEVYLNEPRKVGFI